MGYNTGIEYVESTWNPINGCTRVSEGCRNCYAERFAAKHSDPGAYYHGLAEKKESGPHWTGKLRVETHKMDLPLKWKKPRRIFVNSMSDLFHKDVPAETLFEIFKVMRQCPQHTFLIITKRPEIALKYDLEGLLDWQPHIWMGVSVENIDTAYRLRTLECLHANVKFASFEPLLEDISRSETVQASMNWLDWVIVGGETGDNARPMRKEWACNLRNFCYHASIPFFFKQWGGKKRSRTLDGKEYNEMPVTAQQEVEEPERMSPPDARQQQLLLWG